MVEDLLGTIKFLNDIRIETKKDIYSFTNASSISLAAPGVHPVFQTMDAVDQQPVTRNTQAAEVGRGNESDQPLRRAADDHRTVLRQYGQKRRRVHSPSRTQQGSGALRLGVIERLPFAGIHLMICWLFGFSFSLFVCLW